MVFAIESPQRTHDLAALITTLESKNISVPAEIKDAVILNEYAVTTRYPGPWEEISEGDYRQALDVSEGVVSWAKGVISNK